MQIYATAEITFLSLLTTLLVCVSPFCAALCVCKRYSDSPWEEYDTEEGSQYYYNTGTKETTWDVPKEGVSSSERLSKAAASGGR